LSAGAPLQTPLGELMRSPYPLAGFFRGLLRRGGERRERKGGEGRKGQEGEKRRGRTGWG